MTTVTISPPKATGTARGGRKWFKAIALIALTACAGGAAYVYGVPLLRHDPPPAAEHPTPTVTTTAVRVAGPRLITVTPDTPLAAKLHPDTVRRGTTATPLLTVTGSVAARLGPAAMTGDEHWDFATAEVASAYGDWVGGRADAEAAQTLLAKVKELVAAKIKNYQDIVDRYRHLMEQGAGAPKDYAQAQSDLLQGQIQGATDVYQAEVTLRGARRKLALTERQLLALGVDPAALAKGTVGSALVVADVPEAYVSQVREGQACEARFVAYPGQTFAAKVSKLAPSLAKDSRTLRVIFELDDPDGKLRPGLFADIGLGTEKRDVLTVAAEAVLHIGRADYVLTAAGPGDYQVAEVKLIEPHNGRVEVTGLADGTTVVGPGAILLKPLVVRALADGNGHGGGPAK